MGNQSSSPGQIISLPNGGGALSGIGEKFSPDLYTGTGNFTVPVNLPSGRNGFQPELNLVYSTGHGNGPFGLGWSLNIPGVTRKTSSGVPLFKDNFFDNDSDVFILSGSEDLVPVALWRYDPNDHDKIIPVDNPDSQDWSNAPVVQFRPRTEGLFARILYYRKDTNIRWTVESKDGLKSIYGSSSHDSSHGIISNPGKLSQIYAWKLTETRDPFGNKIRYEYEMDPAGGANQLYLKSVKYIDYGDPSEKFLVHVNFDYEERPDPFSEYRPGFEIRTTRRCKAIRVTTKTDDGNSHPVREYQFSYLSDAYNGVSLLQKLDITGFDDDGNAYSDDPDGRYPRQLPPLTFGYTSFEPETRRFEAVEGSDLPTLTPNMELVDLHGSGLPDILEMNGTVRFWRNLGNGRFDMPRPVGDAPSHALTDPGVQMIDANGDGRMDLLVTSGPLAGYYPMEHGGRWSKKSFQRYTHSPGFNLDDPEVKLVDINGDGYTDILRSGSRLECFFNDPDPSLAWKRTTFASRQSLESFPDVNFSDPRVHLADMTGDGLQDIVLIHDGNVEYWPNLGHNRWGKRVSMRHAPRFRDSAYELGYDPQRLLLGDVVGDGLADLIYIGHDWVMLWINQSGNGWSKEPVIIFGTPPTTSMDNVRLMDLYGTGVSGVLWSSDGLGLHRSSMMFLDFSGGVKPYLLNTMDNHMGAVTRVEYKPSTWYFLKDQQKPATRWRTPLPFPVQVVARVVVTDEISRGKLTTEYHYHHGYWDGAEREFRGFGMVEQLDSESFDKYKSAGLQSDQNGFRHLNKEQYSQPTLVKTWFHQGPVGEEYGDWDENDYTHEYWPEDPQLLGHREQVSNFLGKYNDRGSGIMPSPKNRRIKRDALRSLRGSILRTELFALDNSMFSDRPYTITERAYNLTEITGAAGLPGHKHIFMPHPSADRTTQWERGDDPMTQFVVIDYLDENGVFDHFGRPRRQSAIAMPRLASCRKYITGAITGSIDPNETNILATHTHTGYAHPGPDDPYIHDRAAWTMTYELAPPPAGTDDTNDTLKEALIKQRNQVYLIHDLFKDIVNCRLIGHQINYYDGQDFTGLPAGQTGKYGALIRTRVLVMTGELLDQAYGSRRPDYLDGPQSLPSNAPPVTLATLGYWKEPSNAEPDKASYFIESFRQRISDRGLPIAIRDSLGHDTSMVYDPYDLHPLTVTDAMGMVIGATYNMRLLRPESMTGPNGDTTHLRYNPIGLPLRQFVTGTDAQGNQVGGTEDSSGINYQYNFLNYKRTREDHAFPEALPVYVHSYQRIQHRSSLISEENDRRRHAGQSALNEGEISAMFPVNLEEEVRQFPKRFIQSREYSDGFGRLIQTRTQAEENVFGELGGEVGLPAQPGSPPGHAVYHRVNDNVVVGGWELYDNKGQVISKYEPFFSLGWNFQAEKEAMKGQFTSMFYDPRGKAIRTINPDNSQQRIISGRPKIPDDLALTNAGLELNEVPGNFVPSPWESYSYDSNDLADLTNHGNNNVHESHFYTPSSNVLDGLGRVICLVSRNGTDPVAEWFISRSTYDIRGNLTKVTDHLGRVAFSYSFDLLDRTLKVENIDAGLRTSVYDAQGNLVGYNDSKGSIVLRTYDSLTRPEELWACDNSAGTFTMREKLIYGDSPEASLSMEEIRSGNLLGMLFRHYDEAGLQTFGSFDNNGKLSAAYDFEGNLLEKSRRTIKDDELDDGWQADWSKPGATGDLENTVYQTSRSYDALKRFTGIVYPEDAGGERKVLNIGYNRAGTLENVKLGNDHYVHKIVYNARGQRVMIVFGNGIMTRHLYDEKTFRLKRLRTERYKHETDTTANTETWSGNGQVLQDFSYSYDLEGNITAIEENVSNCGIEGGRHGRDRLVRLFSHDPLYRLLSATGRADKDIGNFNPGTGDQSNGFFPPGSPTPNQINAPDLTEYYKETFLYDPAGNILDMHYKSTSGQWTRHFGMSGITAKQWKENLTQTPGSPAIDWKGTSNRLTSSGGENQATNHNYDANGNLDRLDSEKYHNWDHADRMTGFEIRTGQSSQPTLKARYLYGADGTRVKKWVRRGNNGTHDNSVVDIDGIFQFHHWQRDGGGMNNSLHVMDDHNRIATLRVGSSHPDEGGERVQYHFNDHLGSSHTVAGGDDASTRNFINREEYFSYGETSFGSFGRKRYRYSGKERDEESGLYYYGARYLAPWLARWVSCDPLGIAGGINAYTSFNNNPMRFTDPTGSMGEPTPAETEAGQSLVDSGEICGIEESPPQERSEEKEGAVKGFVRGFTIGIANDAMSKGQAQINDPINTAFLRLVRRYGPEAASGWATEQLAFTERAVNELEDAKTDVSGENLPVQAGALAFRLTQPDQMTSTSRRPRVAGKSGPAPRVVFAPRQIIGVKTTPRKGGQKRAMGGKKAEEESGRQGDQWLHLRALAHGGSQTKENLGAGSAGANYTMLPFELALAQAAREGNKVETEVTATMVGDTSTIESITYRAWINDDLAMDSYLSGKTDMPSSEERSFLHKGINLRKY